MIDAGIGVGTEAEAREDAVQAMHERAMRGASILRRLSAGSTLAEIAHEEGLSHACARELVAEAVALSGFDP